MDIRLAPHDDSLFRSQTASRLPTHRHVDRIPSLVPRKLNENVNAAGVDRMTTATTVVAAVAAVAGIAAGTGPELDHDRDRELDHNLHHHLPLNLDRDNNKGLVKSAGGDLVHPQTRTVTQRVDPPQMVKPVKEANSPVASTLKTATAIASPSKDVLVASKPGRSSRGIPSLPTTTNLSTYPSPSPSSTSTSSSTSASSPSLYPSPSHIRNHSSGAVIAASTSSQPLHPASPARPKTFSEFSTPLVPLEAHASEGTNTANANPLAWGRATKTRKVPASNSRNDLGEQYFNGPPPAMITQRSFPLENSTTTQDWIASVAAQQSPSPTTEQLPLQSPALLNSARSPVEKTSSRPLIQPIRGFKPSSRRSTDMASKRASSNDPDSTLRALEGLDSQQTTMQIDQEEQHSDESDLFLRAAREEELSQRTNELHNDRLTRNDRRMSLIAQRASAPPTGGYIQPFVSRRRGSDNDTSIESRPLDEQDLTSQALPYRSGERERERISALDDLKKSRYHSAAARSSPATPRSFGSREMSPEFQTSHSIARNSVLEQNLPSRGYRQSNLSYSTPRTYNSSPLVARPTDFTMHETPEPSRGVEGTESTVSTTAPSTVWDELDELKSRIHRLELTGKLPATSGAAISRASTDRPPTATTTATTMSSTSPKRGRNNSISPIESTIPEVPSETHSLLSSALAKSKPMLHPDVYKTLEATAADALAISSMMGTSGQPGPISSAQSIVGGISTVTDRQVRRKADSMCRSLTELCLALSEGKNDLTQPFDQTSGRPNSRDTDVRQSIELSNNLRQGMTTDLTRLKSSPRALSRLEARRSSLLIGSSLPSPRFTPSESGTSTQGSLAGRRTSLLLRSSRRGTEEPEEEDDARFRAPSRAATEIGRLRGSPREYTSQQPLPERLPERSGIVQSSLPVRRQYNSANPASSGHSMPPVSSLGGRRYLDRTTPERDTTSVVGRLAEDRAQRKPSINSPLTRTGSLTRRTRQASSADFSAGQNGGYQ